MTRDLAPLSATPALERLLARLRRRLVLQVALHGAGTTALAAALWLLFAFFADWGLRVPGPIRVLHGVLLVALVGFLLWRELLRPLARVPGRAGLSVLVERAHPELHELLVSAAQLQRGEPAAGDGDPVLVRRVLEEADERAREIGTAGVLDERGPRARLGAGAAGAAAVVALAAASPLHAEIFLDRLLGGSRPWPQRTHLTVRVPLRDASATVEESDELVRVRVARGTDVPIVVEAEGTVPSDVTLHFADGRSRVLAPRGGGEFRTLLPSVLEDLAFHATGGDDDDGLPRVEIEVLQPPDVAAIAVEVRPPSYTGLPPETLFDQDVEVVAGSELRIHVLPTPPDAIGVARLLPEDVEVELAPGPFPARAGEPPGDEVPEGLSFPLVAESSLGFRFELVDSSGLSNPDPGLFRVLVSADRPPEVRLLAPGQGDVETVAGGALPVRARASDDFGLVSLGWRITPGGAGGDEPAPLLEGELARAPAEEPPPAALAGAARVEVDDLAAGGALALDQRFSLEARALDVREPEPAAGSSRAVRVRIVSAEELLRRAQDRLARARLETGRLAELQREKRTRAEELHAGLRGDALESADALALGSAAVGQRRVLTDARALLRELATVAEDILYARLDEKAGAALELLDARLAAAEEEGFQAAAWREVARAHRAGEIGSPGLAGTLIELVGLALDVAEGPALEAGEALDRAQGLSAAGPRRDEIARAVELQTQSLERIELLLGRLAEWDNFQNVLQLTRDILNRQKALRDRTRRFAQER